MALGAVLVIHQSIRTEPHYAATVDFSFWKVHLNEKISLMRYSYYSTASIQLTIWRAAVINMSSFYMSGCDVWWRTDLLEVTMYVFSVTDSWLNIHVGSHASWAAKRRHLLHSTFKFILCKVFFFPWLTWILCEDFKMLNNTAVMMKMKMMMMW